MAIEDESDPPDTRRMVLQTVAVIAASGMILWLVNGRGANQISAFVNPPRSSVASAPLPPLTPRGLACQPSQLEITGVMIGCADTVIEEPLDCRAEAARGVFTGLAHVQDRRHHYVMLVSVDSGYHGAGTYALTAWDKFREAPSDGQAKVIWQQDQGRSKWRSTAGSLSIYRGERSGSVLADLYPVDEGAEAAWRIRIDGTWACAAGGGSASFTSGISP